MKVRKTSRWRSVNEISKAWTEYHKKLTKELAEKLSEELIKYAEKYGNAK